MNEDFTKTFHCASQVHCLYCRKDKAWREKYNAPDICPKGILLGDDGKLKNYNPPILFEGPICHGSDFTFIPSPTPKEETQKENNPALPSFGTMTKNVVKAGFKAVVAGVPQRSQEEKNKLLEICVKCEFWREKDNRCSKCGCYLNLKTKLATEHCPEGKW